MKRVQWIQQGVVHRMAGGADFAYAGWPSVICTRDGRVIVGASALRRRHIDPWGRTVVWTGTPEEGFGPGQVVHDSPLDDRDVGLCLLPEGTVLLSFFTLDSRIFAKQLEESLPPPLWQKAQEVLSQIDDTTAEAYAGSWTMRSTDGGNSWQPPVRCPVSTPHGPIVGKDGTLLYVGKQFPPTMNRPFGQLACAVSGDGGCHWQEVGTIPLPEGVTLEQFHEPHMAQCANGDLRAYIRFHTNASQHPYGMWQSLSRDGGRTWTTAAPMEGIQGTPPHVLQHSSGAWVLSYGYREAPFGQRVRISRDEGETWSEEYILRDDGLDGDLGYPCSAELPDGSILTVYYQRLPGDEPTSILYTRWRLAT